MFYCKQESRESKAGHNLLLLPYFHESAGGNVQLPATICKAMDFGKTLYPITNNIYVFQFFLRCDGEWIICRLSSTAIQLQEQRQETFVSIVRPQE